MKVIIMLLSLLLFVNISYSQNNCNFCKAVEKGNFNKVERLFKKEVRKRENGTQFYNGPGSGMQTTHSYNIDTLTMWLKNHPCVADAYPDKCQEKIAIYPGHSSIGVKFNTNKGIVEKCFLLQEGTMGTVNILGWRPHLFEAKNILVYKKIYGCSGFIEQQKINCNPEKNK